MVAPEFGIEAETEFLLTVTCEDVEDQGLTYVTGPVLSDGEWERIGEPGTESEFNLGIMQAGILYGVIIIV